MTAFMKKLLCLAALSAKKRGLDKQEFMIDCSDIWIKCSVMEDLDYKNLMNEIFDMITPQEKR